MARDGNALAGDLDLGTGAGNLKITGDITAMVWLQSPNIGVIIGLYAPLDGNKGWGIAVAITGAPKVFEYWSDTIGAWQRSNTDVTADQNWHHYAVSIVAGGTGRFYFDGVADGTFAHTAPSSSATAFNKRLFADSLSANRYGRRAAHIAVWNAALSASEILALARGINPLRMRRKNLQGYWPLHGYFSPEPDWSMNRYHGTIVGTLPRWTSTPEDPMVEPYSRIWWGSSLIDVATGTNLSVFEPINVVESREVAFTLDVTGIMLEVVNVSDVPIMRLDGLRSEAQDISITELVTVQFVRELSVFDGVGASDVVGDRVVTANPVFVDLVNVTESVTLSVSGAPTAPLIQVVTSDVINVTELISVSRPGVGDALDSVMVSELTSVSLSNLIVSVNESIGVAETIERTHEQGPSIIQVVQVIEARTVTLPTPALSFFEAISLEESIVVAFVLDVVPVIDMVFDSVTVSETVTVELSEGIPKLYVPRRPDIPSIEEVPPEPYIPRRLDQDVTGA